MTSGCWKVVAGLVVTAGFVPNGAAAPPLSTAVDTAVVDFLAEADVPGAAVGVLVDGSLAHARGYGVRSVERGEPVEVDTVFQVGSITKVVTTTLMLQLRDAGRVDPEQALARYLPDGVASPTWETTGGSTSPTLLDLATHRAGLPPNPPNRRNRPNSPSVMEPYSTRELYAALAETRLASEPGTTWSYSNYGFGVLGHALERATNTRYEKLVTHRLLRPLGMQDTRISLTRGLRNRIAAHYWPERERRERDRWVFGEVAAFGGLASTVPDLARFVALHLSASAGSTAGPVSGDALLEMRTPVASYDEGTRGVSAGWFWQDHPRVGRIYFHGGEVDGHSAWISLAPDVGIGIVVLTNVGGNTAERLNSRVARAVLASRSAAETP